MKNNGREIFNQWLEYRNKTSSKPAQKNQTVEQIFENINNKLNILEQPGTETPIKQASSVESKTIHLPQFRITENFGKRTGDESALRAFIQNIANNIQGATWQERVKSLENVLQETCDRACAEAKGTANIVSSLIFLDCLATIIYEFGHTAAGYIFESLMATLMGADVVQIDAAKGNILDIDNAKEPGSGLSLKLLSESSRVEGSYNSLVNYYKKYKKGVPYLLALKIGKSAKEIKSVSFNYVEILPRKEDIQAILNQEAESSLKEGGAKKQVLKQLPKQNIANVSDEIGKFYIAKITAKEKGAMRFGFEPNTILPFTKHEATLNLGDYNKLRERTAILIGALKQDVMGAFDNLNELMDNLTLYFADAKGGVERAQAASSNANNIINILKQK